MANLTLYTAIPSRGLTAQWMLEELGVPHDVQLLSLDKQEHKRAQFLAINGLGRVPALVHGDTVVTETAAICAYLAEVFPEAGLDVPAGDPDRGSYLRWLFFAPATAEPTVIWKMLGDGAQAFDYQPYAKIEEVADVLATHLSTRRYMVAERFTAADIMIGATVMWGLELAPVLPRLPALTEYWSRLSQRPAWQRVQQLLSSAG